MLTNYLKIAVRNLLRHKVYSFINIMGLAIGMACCMLILIYIQHEFSYNMHHEKADRIYRVYKKKQAPGKELYYSPLTLGAAGPAMATDFPEVEKATRFLNRSMFVYHEERGFDQDVLVGDNSFMDVFTYPMVKGDAQTGLKEPFTAFITESLAKKLFGDADPMGQTVSVTWKWLNGDFRVTGVMKDMVSTSSGSLWFDMVTTTTTPLKDRPEFWNMLLENWRSDANFHPLITYILLREGADISNVEAGLEAFTRRYFGDGPVQDKGYALQPLSRMYLYTKQDYNLAGWFGAAGDIQRIYVFGLIGVFIIAIACINFMNLATARSATRAREVGMRKVIGAYRSQLIRQFLGESMLATVLAMVLALGLAALLLPEVNGFLNKQLSLTANAVWMGVGLTLVVGLLAGSYPAFFLSNFEPIDVLKGGRARSSGARMRKALVVVQFAISIVLIIGTVVAYRQTEFMLQKDPGYKKDQVLILPLMKKDVSLWGRIDVIKQRFLQHPSVLKVATSLFPPGMQNDTDKWPILAAGMTDPVDVHFLPVDDDFLDVYEIPLVAGRNLGDSDRFDFWNEENLPALRVLLNETAARELGGVKPGTHVRFERGDGQLDIEVVGIFKDFHNQTLHHPIKPLMLQFTTHRNFVSLRIQMQNLPETLAFVGEVWKSFLPNNPVDRWFMDEMLQAFYQNEIKMRSLYAFCAALAVFVACLGLMGLVAYTAEVRTKEIGIRKVMGASEPQLVGLLVKEFLLLIGIASILAWPVAWKVMAGWLQGFAYRVDLSVWFFLSGTVLAVVIALLTVSYQALKAARVNPVVALRYE